ncbi:MAG TPA: polyprenyl synthetase family protein [Acidimicrobiales bacterium]|nr:polyprenyl synthetase family protein [Acidimicrobiales bacterium]
MAARVEGRIERLFDAELSRWRALDAALVEPLRSLQRLVEAGGKRLRPAFCFWGFVGAGGNPDDPRVIDAGAAFELLHAFALVHDDVMDGSDTRRGEATAHVEFGELHRSSGTWRGEARRFGEGVAILIGDLSHVYADLLLDGAHADVAPIWHELRLELNVGQYLDILGTARGDRDPAMARRIARYKSGKYTIERPLHVGAALAGRLDALAAPLSAYGDPLGEAFQLRDDVLGAFGDEELTGKPVGQDLREGKPTPMLAAATRRADGGQTRVLDRVGADDLSDGEVAAAQQVILDTGAADEMEARITTLTEQAIRAIQVADITAEARDALVELAAYVASRDT